MNFVLNWSEWMKRVKCGGTYQFWDVFCLCAPWPDLSANWSPPQRPFCGRWTLERDRSDRWKLIFWKKINWLCEIFCGRCHVIGCVATGMESSFSDNYLNYVKHDFSKKLERKVHFHWNSFKVKSFKINNKQQNRLIKIKIKMLLCY